MGGEPIEMGQLGLLDTARRLSLQIPARRRRGVRQNHNIGVVWEGSQFVTHSLAIVNRELCSALLERGIDIGIKLYEDHDYAAGDDSKLMKLEERFGCSPRNRTQIHVRHQWPPSFERPEVGKWVMIQPWEYGFIPAPWLQPMRDEVDEIWVPSRYARQCYIDSGISSAKVFVIPNGVDVTRFCPQAPPAQFATNKSFKFLFVGGTIPRKGIQLLLETYRRFFKREDDVCLVIKDMGGKGVYRGSTAQDQIRAFADDPVAPEIEYIDYHLRHDQVAGLFTAADVLVHPYHGEGFGMPMAEAMACGRPAIVTGLGAAMDFCNQQNSYLIPASRHDMPTKKISEMDACGYPWLANPDPDALGYLMREAVLSPAKRMEKGRAARRTIVDEFTWNHAADMVELRLQALATSKPDANSARSLAGLAEQELIRRLREEPRNTRLVVQLSELLQREDRIDEAADILSLALKNMPDEPLLLEQLESLSKELGFSNGQTNVS